MSEEMKLILALYDHLGLEATARGSGVTDELVRDDLFSRDNPEYDYTVQIKR